MKRKLIYATGFILLGLFIFYMTYSIRNEPVPEMLTYAFGLVACIFITLLLYNLLRRLRK